MAPAVTLTLAGKERLLSRSFQALVLGAQLAMTGFSPTSPVVSVLMAVHDGETTVRRALESLQAQTFSNFEMVVVDAGSTDGTARILDAMSERDMRIAVTHVAEKDLSQALDLALSRARGEYLLVMRQSAWAEPALLEELLEAAQGSDLELVVGGFTVNVAVGARELALVAQSEDRSFLTQHDFRAAAWSLFDRGLLAPVCAKLFDRHAALAAGAGFAAHGAEGAGMVGSVHAFTLAFLRDVERVGMISTTRYHVALSAGDPDLPAPGTQTYLRLEAEYAATLALLRHWGMEGDAASMEMLQRRYVELLAACIDGVAGRGPIAPKSEDLERVSRMISTEHAQLAASVAQPRDGFTRAMTPSIRNGNARKAYSQAKLWGLLRHGMPAGTSPDAYV